MLRTDPAFFNNVFFDKKSIFSIDVIFKYNSVIFGCASQGRISADNAWTRLVGGEFDSLKMRFFGASYHGKTIHHDGDYGGTRKGRAEAPPSARLTATGTRGAHLSSVAVLTTC